MYRAPTAERRLNRHEMFEDIRRLRADELKRAALRKELARSGTHRRNELPAVPLLFVCVAAAVTMALLGLAAGLGMAPVQ